jgi:hypothetical protein
MKGRIRSWPGEKCPKCHGSFESIDHPLIKGKQIDILCRFCLTRPLRVYIDARGIRDRRGEKIGNVVKSTDGEPYFSFNAADITLSTIRGQLKAGTLDARMWQSEKTRKYQLPDLRDEYVSALLRGGRGRGHQNQTERVLTELSEVIGPRDCRTLTGDDLQALDKEYVRRGVEGLARKKYLQQVQAFVRWFNRYHLPHPQRIEVPPLPMIGIVRKEIGWIDTPEQEGTLALIPFPNLHLAYRVLFVTGMRIGEACGLKKKDLVKNADGTFLYVQRAISQWKKEKTTKTGSWMMKPIPEPLFLELEAICRDRFPGDFLWTTRYGNAYSPGRLSTVWHKASVASGLNISLYAACRHSKATREMIDLQKEMWRKVGRVLGDTVKIARGYVRPIEERRVRDLREDVRK